MSPCPGSELHPCECGRADCPWRARWTLDLGSGCFGSWMGGEPASATRLLVLHRKPNGEECHAVIGLDRPETRALPEAQRPRLLWFVVQLDPLSIAPSIRCGCGAHGTISNGQWRHEA